jgi:hypothetical protein
VTSSVGTGISTREATSVCGLWIVEPNMRLRTLKGLFLGGSSRLSSGLHGMTLPFGLRHARVFPVISSQPSSRGSGPSSPDHVLPRHVVLLVVTPCLFTDIAPRSDNPAQRPEPRTSLLAKTV